MNLSTSRRSRRIVAVLLVAGPLAMTSNVARAEASPSDDTTTADASAAVIEELPSTLVPSAADVIAVDGLGTIATENGGVVVMPEDAGDGVDVRTPSGVVVSIGLPGASTNDQASVADGLAVYDSALPDASIAVQALEGGGVQALAVIDGPGAPTDYRYPIDSADLAALVQTADGSVTMLDAEGGAVGHISAPWAVDADGRAVPTSYRIEGTTLIQTVDHSTSAVAYPVVADPCFWGWKCAKQVVKGAVGGALAGAVGGCVLGALSTSFGGGFGCPAGAVGGGVSGAAAGAVSGWWGV